RRLQHDEGLLSVRGDFRGAAGTGQARVRTFVMTDYRGVEVAEAVNLRRTEKAHVHTPCLQVVAEDLRQRHDAGRGLRQFAITDGPRQYLGPAASGRHAPLGQCSTVVTTRCGSTMAFIPAGSVSAISSTVTNNVVAASAASRCAPTIPFSATLPARSARCACNTVTSGLSAG